MKHRTNYMEQEKNQQERKQRHEKRHRKHRNKQSCNSLSEFACVITALALFLGVIFLETNHGKYQFIMPTNLFQNYSFNIMTKPYTQPTRLRITNKCYFPIWIQHSNNVIDQQNIQLNYTEYYDYNIPNGGLASTMFWPKVGCNFNGTNCEIGQSVPPCPDGGCQPPIDSKFEATWADVNCPQINPTSPCMTHYDSSQVDGYTLPFNIDAYGNGANIGTCVSTKCSVLDFDKCPQHENISSQYNNTDLRVYSQRDPNMVVGCMSPCKKLNYPSPWGYGLSEECDPTLHMCCPTDNKRIKNGTCTWSTHCATPSACRNKKL